MGTGPAWREPAREEYLRPRRRDPVFLKARPRSPAGGGAVSAGCRIAPSRVRGAGSPTVLEPLLEVVVPVANDARQAEIPGSTAAKPPRLESADRNVEDRRGLGLGEERIHVMPSVMMESVTWV